MTTETNAAMPEFSSFLTTLGPTAGVIIVVWYFLGYLKDQRAASAAEAVEERKRFADTMEKIAADHREAMHIIGTRVDKLDDTQRALLAEIRKDMEKRAS